MAQSMAQSYPQSFRDFTFLHFAISPCQLGSQMDFLWGQDSCRHHIRAWQLLVSSLGLLLGARRLSWNPLADFLSASLFKSLTGRRAVPWMARAVRTIQRGSQSCASISCPSKQPLGGEEIYRGDSSRKEELDQKWITAACFISCKVEIIMALNKIIVRTV